MKILIVSEYIAPFQSIASIRWTKIAKYLKKAHPEITISVVTNQKDYALSEDSKKIARRDELLEKDLAAFDQYIEVPNDKPMQIYNQVKKKSQKEVQNIDFAKRMDTQLNGMQFVRSILLEIIRDLKDQLLFFQEVKFACKEVLDCDVVITTYGPIWTHLVGERLKKKIPKIVWVADFRDPYAKEGESKWSYSRHCRFTMKHLKSADMVFRVNSMLPTNTPPNVPVYTISNGYDPDERLERKKPSKFTLVFTGTLCGKNSDIGIVCRALLDLCEDGKIEKADIEVAYAGAYGQMAKSLAADYQAEEVLRDYGVLKRQDSLKMQQNSAILVLAAENTKREKSFWTGKAYEYMMAQKPIIYVIAGDVPHSAPSKNIDRIGGYCYEKCRHEETYQGLKNFIFEKYQEWKITGDVSVQQDKKYIEQYSYPHIAEQVWELIQKQMERKKSSESTTA